MNQLYPEHQLWHNLVRQAPYLSSRMKRRYASILARLSDRVDRNRQSQAMKAAEECPHLALRILLSDLETPVRELSDLGLSLAGDVLPHRYPTVFWDMTFDEAIEKGLPIDSVTVIGKTATMEQIREIAERSGNLTEYIERQAPLEQTEVPIHPDRHARLLRVPGEDMVPLVALRWPEGSLSERIAAEHTIDSFLLPTVNQKVHNFQFKVSDDYMWIQDPLMKDPWIVAPNLGTTLEDMLRGNTLNPDVRRQVIDALAEFRRSMIDTGIIWGGFAPRNMFLSNDNIQLIDFESACDLNEDRLTAANLLLWHRVWFADSLTTEEIDEIFGTSLNPLMIEPSTEIPSDRFERALHGRSATTWQNRIELLQSTLRIEGRHLRSSNELDDGILFGHQVGHFWGDYLDPSVEIDIFLLLRRAIDLGDRVLTSCLEVFEAAMEADVIDNLLDAARGSKDFVGRNTHFLAKAAREYTPGTLALMRDTIGTWYQDLQVNPQRLLDVLQCHLDREKAKVDRQFLVDHFIGEALSRSQHESLLEDVLRTGLRFVYGDSRNGKFLQYKSNEELIQIVGEALPKVSRPFEDVLRWFEANIAQYSISQADSHYIAFPDSGNALSAIAGAILAPLLNQNMIAVDRSAPIATFVETQVIEWLRELVGYQSSDLNKLTGVRDMAGLWTTGGHMSNHIAMLVALGEHFPEVRSVGLQNLPIAPAVVMSGPIAHYSHSDAAFHLGLGWNNVLLVGAEANYTTSVSAVDELLSNPPQGKRPFMVVGVAGNCRTTGLDDLNALADICAQHNIWFHVDACHGGNLLFSRTLRNELLSGIERADSVSIDPHKGLFTPYPSSYVLFRERGKLCQFSRHQAVVQEPGTWDLGLIMPFFGSRGFDSLRTWFLIKVLGLDAIGAAVEYRQSLIRYFEKRLRETPLFVPLNNVDFYRLTFLFCPHDCLHYLSSLAPEQMQIAVRILSQFTSRLNTELYTQGLVCFDEHTLQDLDNRIGLGTTAKYTIMATCPGNPLLSENDLDEAFTSLLHHARMLADEFREALVTGLDVEERSKARGPAGWH